MMLLDHISFVTTAGRTRFVKLEKCRSTTSDASDQPLLVQHLATVPPFVGFSSNFGAALCRQNAVGCRELKKLGVALLTAAALSVAAATSAEARGFGGFHGGFHNGGFHGGGFGGFHRGGVGGFHRGFGGIGAGLFAGSLLGAYSYPYDYSYRSNYGYPAYGYYPYGYPAYGYFPYSYRARRVVIVRRPHRVIHAHRVHRAAIVTPHQLRGGHARFTPPHQDGMAHAR
jgi:hypothetical protein